MQTPSFLFDEESQRVQDQSVQDMFVSFLAFGGVNPKKQLNGRVTIIHISMMTRKYYLVPAPWLDLETPDSFFGNWMLNFDRDINLITAVGKNQLHKINLNQNLQKINLHQTGISGYRQILSMSHNNDIALSVEKQGRNSDENEPENCLEQALREMEDDEFQFSRGSINEEIGENPFMRNS